jgi:K+-transporting ATPase ATPase C chain
MGNVIVVALRATIVTLVLTGIAYPVAMTGLSQLLFHGKANGSMVEVGGKVVGSELLGQITSNPGYFQPRPSAAGQNGYDPTASSGSNLGPTSQKLKDRVAGDIERLQKENPNAPGPVPDELVTTSGSGLDPHLSPDAARWQIPRIASFRKVAPDRIRAIVEGAIEDRTLGVLGEPRVNVLLLNVALDKQLGQPPEAPPAPSGSSSSAAAPAPAPIAGDPPPPRP